MKPAALLSLLGVAILIAFIPGCEHPPPHDETFALDLANYDSGKDPVARVQRIEVYEQAGPGRPEFKALGKISDPVRARGMIKFLRAAIFHVGRENVAVPKWCRFSLRVTCMGESE
ncbi:MAG TPA: hypothetical protein VHM91_00410 [Verrucomicrobiales bacterium]|jgi:hypothetical protein|nr:hypothetical protein [Verrucomicrobiales bacterium]